MKNIRLILLLFSIAFIGYNCSINPYKSGEVLYNNFCSNCHGKDGLGLADLYPPLKNADYLKTHTSEITCIIREGMKGVIKVNGKTYNEEMPANPRLDGVAITNISNYINYMWPYQEEYTTIVEVRSQLTQCN